MATENGSAEPAKPNEKPGEKPGGKTNTNGKTDGKRAVTPITVTHPENVGVESIQLFREPPWMLRLTIQDDRSYLRVKIVRAAPLSHPNRYICILDAKDEEICMIDDPKLQRQRHGGPAGLLSLRRRLRQTRQRRQQAFRLKRQRRGGPGGLLSFR